jgi:hypothetical protein
MNAATARAYAAWRRSEGGVIASAVRGTPVASDASDD